ncbi:hypothetical protein QWY86_05425 [Pedobacter aquatilis]|uniref:hypothetical protein n=1 Tax=Pedobacter aquatilis TaxID=351343 RepID=UPI0025B5A87D|nr:hypothetical protein [Pedobacter aquatilis]MDN3586097.1 hypothetical protein [Pedobacter aquatilis]
MTDQEKMEYWLPISLWNLNELFTTESIAPYALYQLRGFGNPSSRQKEPSEQEYYLTLYRQAPSSGPALKIHPSRLDPQMLENADGYSRYFQTIYLKRGYVAFYFDNEEQVQMLHVNSRMLLEVKAIEKYRFKGALSFEPFQVYPQKMIRTESLRASGSNNPPSDLWRGPGFDRALNQIKGLIFSLYRGILSQPGPKAMELENLLRNWRNAIGTARTNIAMSSSYNADWAMPINELGAGIRELYLGDSSGKLETLDILKLRMAEIDKLYLQKAQELERQHAPVYQQAYQDCIAEVEQARRNLVSFEDSAGISELKIELREIKDAEKQNGRAKGKTRSYFPKSSWEGRRKIALNESIASFSQDLGYTSLKSRLAGLEEQLKGFSFGGSEFDSTIDDQFSRVAGVVSDLLDHTKDRAQAKRRLNRSPSLSGLKVNIGLLISYQASNLLEKAVVPKFIEQLPGDLHLGSTDQKLLQFALNAALATAQQNQGHISNAQVQHFTEVLGMSLLAESKVSGENFSAELEYLRDYLKYKNGKVDRFDFPSEGLLLRNIFTFMLRPSGFESQEKLTSERNISPGYYASVLWASIRGFADLPKTFTEVVYNSDQDEHFSSLDSALEVSTGIS